MTATTEGKRRPPCPFCGAERRWSFYTQCLIHVSPRRSRACQNIRAAKERAEQAQVERDAWLAARATK